MFIVLSFSIMASSTQDNAGTPAQQRTPYKDVALFHSLPRTNADFIRVRRLLPYDDFDDVETIADTSPIYNVGYDIANPPTTVLCDIPGRCYESLHAFTY